MIRPPSAIRRAACWQAKNVPLTLTAKIRSNSSSVTSASGLLNMIPALLTRMSSLPNCRIVVVEQPLHVGDLAHVGLDGDGLPSRRLDLRRRPRSAASALPA